MRLAQLFPVMVLAFIFVGCGGGHGDSHAKTDSHGTSKGHGASKGHGDSHGHDAKKGHGDSHGAKKDHGAKEHGASKDHGGGHGGGDAHGKAKEHAHAPTPTGPKLGPLTVQELTELLEGTSTRNDPQKQTEIALGEFKITHGSPLDYELVTVRFKAFVVVPHAKQEETTMLMEKLQQRLRDVVIRVVKEADYGAIQDPSLAHLRSEISLAVNQTIRRNHVRGVVFSDYMVDRG